MATMKTRPDATQFNSPLTSPQEPADATWRSRPSADSRLLDDSLKTGVWPDSVQVIGGQLSMRLPTG